MGRMRSSLWAGFRVLARPRWAAATVAVAIQLYPAAAWAQKSARLPGVDTGRLQWGLFAAIIILACVAGFLNPKRSHLG